MSEILLSSVAVDYGLRTSLMLLCRRVPRRFAWYGAYWYKAFPLDMSQFSELFNTTRIPR